MIFTMKEVKNTTGQIIAFYDSKMKPVNFNLSCWIEEVKRRNK